MQLITPHRPEPITASRENICSVLHDLIGKRDPYVILDSGSAGEFMQALWTPAGFLMEFQEGGVANHFQTIRRDLSLAEVAAALEEYAKGNESTWRSAFLFKRIDPRPSAYLGGIRVGRLVRAWWPLLAATMFVIVMMSLKLWGCA